MAFDPRMIDDLARRLAGAVPENVTALGRDLEQNFKGVLQSQLARLDLVTREEFDVQANVLRRTREKLAALGVDPEGYELHNSRVSPLVPKMVDTLYERLQRRGYLRRECERLVNQDRNIFASLLLKLGEADAMLCGLHGRYDTHFDHVSAVIGQRPGAKVYATMNALMLEEHNLFITDTFINEQPSSEELAEIDRISGEEDINLWERSSRS